MKFLYNNSYTLSLVFSFFVFAIFLKEYFSFGAFLDESGGSGSMSVAISYLTEIFAWFSLLFSATSFIRAIKENKIIKSIFFAVLFGMAFFAVGNLSF